MPRRKANSMPDSKPAQIPLLDVINQPNKGKMDIQTLQTFQTLLSTQASAFSAFLDTATDEIKPDEDKLSALLKDHYSQLITIVHAKFPPPETNIVSTPPSKKRSPFIVTPNRRTPTRPTTTPPNRNSLTRTTPTPNRNGPTRTAATPLPFTPHRNGPVRPTTTDTPPNRNSLTRTTPTPNRNGPTRTATPLPITPNRNGPVRPTTTGTPPNRNGPARTSSTTIPLPATPKPRPARIPRSTGGADTIFRAPKLGSSASKPRRSGEELPGQSPPKKVKKAVGNPNHGGLDSF